MSSCSARIQLANSRAAHPLAVHFADDLGQAHVWRALTRPGALTVTKLWTDVGKSAVRQPEGEIGAGLERDGGGAAEVDELDDDGGASLDVVNVPLRESASI
jgi:hypothetical protein